MGKPRSESRFQIFKFGGELEGDALKHAAGLVRSAAPDVFVVTSADARATALLLDLTRCANGANRPQAPCPRLQKNSARWCTAMPPSLPQPASVSTLKRSSARRC